MTFILSGTPNKRRNERFQEPFNTSRDKRGLKVLVFTTQPVDADTDATMDSVVVKLYLKNRSGVDTSFEGNVTVALNNIGEATLGGTKTVAAVSGVATFDDLDVDTVGIYTLVATTPTHSEAISDAFEITDP